ncbi:MAG: hypothetical protein PHC44_10415 [Lutispora sp.]|nr:hypothetical protein [Lutispora sp.]
MESYFPSGPIDIATRIFSLSLDSAEGRVAKDHYIKIRGDKIPDKDFIIKLYYKWVPSGKSEASVQQYYMIEYQPEDFGNKGKPFNLSSKEIQMTDAGILMLWFDEVDDEGNYIHFKKDGVNIKNPFIDYGDPLTEDEIIAAFRAIKLMQPLREKTINAVADKYVKAYAKLSDMGISMNHLLTFDYNVDKNYTLVDLSGQERIFNIKIDNIDPSIPHIPKEQIWLEDEDGNKVLSYINGEQIHAFSNIYNKDDETDTKSTYVYESVYLKDPIQAVIFDKDIEIKEFTINTDTIDTSHEHMGK